MNKTILLNTVFVSAAAAMAAGAASAQTAQQQQRPRDVITVTATKTEQSAQDIPVAVSALDSQDLDELRIDTFADYLLQLPNVTAGGNGPGQRTIYIRGLASTTPNLTTAGVAGLAPNVAFYLDEQPLAQPGRNLDVYAADLERIEVLPGPQGTLFGASSQAGTVRMITNKPNIGVFEAYSNFGFSWTDGGEMSSNVTATINLPVTEKFAVRGVVYNDHMGGYIDNVAGTIDASQSARFRPAGTVRANGVPVSPLRAGFQSTSDLSNVTFLEANNDGLVEDDFNDATYAGFRVSGRYEFNSDWRATVSYSQQTLDKDGVFFVDPELDDYEIQRFSRDELEDDFTNIAWTLEGRLAMLDVVYTGAYTERDADQTVDYTDYLFVGQYLPDYICDYSVVYPAYLGLSAPEGTCQQPNLFVKSTTRTEVNSHELRFTTPQDYRFRVTAGGFYSDLTLDERNDFTYPGSKEVVNANGTIGFQSLPPNFPLTNGAATSGQIGNETQGFFTDPGPLPPGVVFRNDVRRTDEQLGLFGEATFDVIPDMFSITGGARWYDVEVDLFGSANSSFDILFPATDANGNPVDAQAFGTNISRQYAPGNPFGAPDSAVAEGVIFKLTGTWTPTEDLLFYATWSEGFRPGLLNRPGGAQGPGGFTVPFELDTDDVTNWELGWKTFLFDGALRLNGNAFFIEVEDLQTTIFDPSITNLFFSANAANADIYGLEADFSWQPRTMEGLTIGGAFSALDTEITEVLVPTNDVLEGSELAFAPEFQGNLHVRYQWQMGDGYTAHIQPQVLHSSEFFSDVIEINKIEVEGYTTISLAAGLAKDRWNVEIFGENLFNDNGQTSSNFVFDRERATPVRPRTIGVRFGVQY